ncbi:MAG: hypothetical protein RQ761_01355 [Bacteroidales bacterium]|nr:hypothetical protein [Bacteroidales bacterium]
MKKRTSIILMAIFTLFLASCGNKVTVDTADAPQEIKDAVLESYRLSEKLTQIQVEAGQDMKLDQNEIEEITEAFKHLAIVNNKNAEDFASNNYFIALRTEYKDTFDILANKVVFLKDCEGYDKLGLTIQKAALEVRNVTELPEQEVTEVPDTAIAEPIEE